MNSNKVEEGLFYLLIFLTLKIIGQIMWMCILFAWAVLVWVVETICINLPAISRNIKINLPAISHNIKLARANAYNSIKLAIATVYNSIKARN